ncbi:MAG: di-trans,poly-cis-decaprenylcistransferase [Xanthobacteraceae bacterium]
MQSTLDCSNQLHVAIIMDGNGRWATARGRPRSAGHQAGVESVRRVVEAAPGLGITTLTLFAFSSDNWRRPCTEVAVIMRLMRHYLRTEVARLVENGIRLTLIGRRDRLPDGLADAIATAERATMRGERLHLRVALDYSARAAILKAAALCPSGSAPTSEEFSWLLTGHAPLRGRDVDLLIRSGGEKRLSDFLLWECAYAELYFTDRMWPDFTADDLAFAVSEFRHRDRRFGAAESTPAPAADPALAPPIGVQPAIYGSSSVSQ